jgi:hypothetical protein
MTWNLTGNQTWNLTWEMKHYCFSSGIFYELVQYKIGSAMGSLTRISLTPPISRLPSQPPIMLLIRFEGKGRLIDSSQESSSASAAEITSNACETRVYNVYIGVLPLFPIAQK